MGYDAKILKANQFAGFFTFDLFNVLILMPGIHYYILLVQLDNRKRGKGEKLQEGADRFIP